MKTFRAIKCIPKTQPSSFLLEASLLKNLRHPGIPIIYDIEEDESFNYLIEEYIQGESLYAYIQSHDNISQEPVLSFGLQLCDIISFLHNQKPKPILYLDLKPEHIILCGDQIKLIDFGIATSWHSAGNQCHSYGTRGFAAPEQYNSKIDGVRTDIYGIGAVLYYMLTKEMLPYVPNIARSFYCQIPKYCSKKFKHIILTATSQEIEKRYKNVRQLQEELQKESMYLTSQNSDKHLYKKIIVAGSQSRIGTTHVSISLVNWMNRIRPIAIYEEKNNKNNILGALAQYKRGFCEKQGSYYYHSFCARLDSNEKVSKVSHESILVQDFGTDLDAITRQELSDLQILILGSKPWEWEEAIKAYQIMSGEDNLLLICNYNYKQIAQEYSNFFQKKVFCFPFDQDPFANTKEKNQLFAQLMKEGGD